MYMKKVVSFIIVGDYMLRFIQHFYDQYTVDIPIFQDDNSGVYREGCLCEWFDEYLGTPSHFDWPAKSHDLNPIENLCDFWNNK